MNEEAMLLDGFWDACLGGDYKDGKAVYSIEKILKILMKRDGMTEEEALEYFDFNIAGAYVGEMTPMYVWTSAKYLIS
jgi:hypothetical protein